MDSMLIIFIIYVIKMVKHYVLFNQNIILYLVDMQILNGIKKIVL